VSTATAEAIRMMMRITRKRGVLVPEKMNPFIKKVVETWLWPVDGVLIRYRIDPAEGILILDKFSENEIGGLYLENPSFLGEIIEETDLLNDYVKKKKFIFIVNAEPLSLGLLKPPGECWKRV
jgi:glycine dehydrogenase subunit 1